MKIAILIEDHYQVLEAWYPYLRLKEAGIEPEFAGRERKEYKSKEGYPVQAKVEFKEIKSDDYSGVIIPGGYAPDILRRYNEVNGLVQELDKSKKLVAAICHAGWVLISAGILKNRKVTCFSSLKDDVKNAGAIYSDEEVVVDRNLITSRNPYDLPVFCSEILKFLKKS